jgi:hypothetical protein
MRGILSSGGSAALPLIAERGYQLVYHAGGHRKIGRDHWKNRRAGRILRSVFFNSGVKMSSGAEKRS